MRAFLPFLLCLAACASTTSKESDTGTGLPDETRLKVVKHANTDAIGLFLTQLDLQIRAWTNLSLTAANHGDRNKKERLEQHLVNETQLREQDLITQLEVGPPKNRKISAVALGFTGSPKALSPLLGALDDTDQEVVSNALLGLALLGDDQTPLEGVLAAMRRSEDDKTRGNAAWAVYEIVKAGGGNEGVLPAARAALVDPSEIVRTQATRILAHELDSDAVDSIAMLLDDDVPLVASASARALAYIAGHDPHAKGPCARALAASLDRVEEDAVRQNILVLLQRISKANYGKDSEDWLTWAHRLP